MTQLNEVHRVTSLSESDLFSESTWSAYESMLEGLDLFESCNIRRPSSSISLPLPVVCCITKDSSTQTEQPVSVNEEMPATKQGLLTVKKSASYEGPQKESTQTSDGQALLHCSVPSSLKRNDTANNKSSM